jgi:hydrogenase nickel incorporation protein HypA/HybF
MHEISLVRSLLAQAEEIAAAEDGGALVRVRIQVGPLSGVEGALLGSAWDEWCAAIGRRGVELEVEDVPLVARCATCGREFEPVRFRFACPACGGSETETIAGDGVILHSITVEDRQGASI